MNDKNPGSILLVEDNLQDIELMTHALKKHNLTNRLHVVEDGVAALDFLFCRGKYAEREMHLHPKVILLDLKLPKVNGLEVLRAIKEDKQTSMIPVVMVTSSNEDPDIQTAYQLGANSYVVKPVNFDDFMEAMSLVGFYWIQINQTSE
jgi:two-component system, response regulator